MFHDVSWDCSCFHQPKKIPIPRYQEILNAQSTLLLLCCLKEEWTTLLSRKHRNLTDGQTTRGLSFDSDDLDLFMSFPMTKRPLYAQVSVHPCLLKWSFSCRKHRAIRPNISVKHISAPSHVIWESHRFTLIWTSAGGSCSRPSPGRRRRRPTDRDRWSGSRAVRLGDTGVVRSCELAGGVGTENRPRGLFKTLDNRIHARIDRTVFIPSKKQSIAWIIGQLDVTSIYWGTTTFEDPLPE